MSVPIRLIRTIQSNIDSTIISDGCLYVATDTGKIFLDLPDRRIELASIRTGSGLKQSDNVVQANVADVVNSSGRSLVDAYGVAHVSSGGGGGGGESDINIEYSDGTMSFIFD